MPTYEMPILLRVMNKPDNVSTLKRMANVIFGTGGFIRKIENWGEKDLPIRITAHGKVHKKAGHFLLSFDVPPSTVKYITEEFQRDIDILRALVFKQEERNVLNTDCTIEEEMLPPPYRPSVQKLLQTAEKQRSTKHKFKYNSGLDYYPFNR